MQYSESDFRDCAANDKMSDWCDSVSQGCTGIRERFAGPDLSSQTGCGWNSDRMAPVLGDISAKQQFVRGVFLP
jgi:hypothetical protein